MRSAQTTEVKPCARRVNICPPSRKAWGEPLLMLRTSFGVFAPQSPLLRIHCLLGSRGRADVEFLENGGNFGVGKSFLFEEGLELGLFSPSRFQRLKTGS